MMIYIKILTTLFFTSLPLLHVKAQDTIFEKEDSIFIEGIIKEKSAENIHTTGDRIISIAKEFYGRSYVAGTLDRYTHEPLFVSCNELDCTTFVELVIALSMPNEGFHSLCKNIERLRYRDGKRNGYASRLHYISWWIDDCAKQNVITEIYTNKHTGTQQKELNFMSRHPEKYKQLKDNPEMVKTIAEYEKAFNRREVKYIPKEYIPKLNKNEIKNGDIIAFVTDIKGLDVTHIGFAYWEKGKLHMIHASSKEKKVIFDSTPLCEYIATKKHHQGIRVLRAL